MSEEKVLKVPIDWTPEQVANFQARMDEALKSGKLGAQYELSPTVQIDNVLKIIADWEQDYFVPISLPVHVRNHVDAALAQLRERIKGLSS